jgi:hypothetical protein
MRPHVFHWLEQTTSLRNWQSMSEERDQNLAEAEADVEAGEKLVCEQEARVKRMRIAGLDVRHAEALLEAYRYALKLAAESKAALQRKLGK